MKEKIAILGPEYSYCHILAQKAFPEGTFELCSNIEQVFKEVNAGKYKSGIVPAENMLHGSVRESLNGLKKYKIKINRSFDLPIHHCLASKSSNYSVIISKPEALSQCSRFLESVSSKIEVQESQSTSEAMNLASKNSKYAAIGSTDAAKNLGLNILKKNIEDSKDNVTRFILLSKKEKRDKMRNKNYRTSLIITPKRDKPGLLYEILAVFKSENINLTKIESIPTGKRLGEYEFFIEIESNQGTKAAIESLKKTHDVYSFGSYDIKSYP